MSSLIEGWFQLSGGRVFEDPKDPNRKTYLVLHDACASLGPIKAAKPIDSELRIYPGGDPIDNMVLHVQGRFCVVSPTGETPFLLAEIHRFDIMHIADPSAETTPDTVRTSVTTCGRAIPSDVVTDTRDRYFGLEMKEYIRDISHEFNITCRLNRTTSRRWERTNVPVQGTLVMLSGFLFGESPETMFIEVETMHFVSSARGGEGGGPFQSPGKSKFGIPTRIRGQASVAALDPPSPSPQTTTPLSLLPIPTPIPIDDDQAGPSVTLSVAPPAGKTRAAKNKRKSSGSASVEPITTNEEDDEPVGKRRKGKSRAKVT